MLHLRRVRYSVRRENRLPARDKAGCCTLAYRVSSHRVLLRRRRAYVFVCVCMRARARACHRHVEKRVLAKFRLLLLVNVPTLPASTSIDRAEDEARFNPPGVKRARSRVRRRRKEELSRNPNSYNFA